MLIYLAVRNVWMQAHFRFIMIYLLKNLYVSSVYKKAIFQVAFLFRTRLEELIRQKQFELQLNEDTC